MRNSTGTSPSLAGRTRTVDGEICSMRCRLASYGYCEVNPLDLDRLVPPQLGDACRVVAELGQDRVGVLAQQRRAVADAAGGGGEPDRHLGDRSGLGQAGIVEGREEAHRPRLRLVQRLLRLPHL